MAFWRAQSLRTNKDCHKKGRCSNAKSEAQVRTKHRIRVLFTDKCDKGNREALNDT